jgi:Oxidoreductase family, NAD-binding Rossmann fold
MKPAPAPRPPSPCRRAFVQGGAVLALTAASYARVPSANDRVGVGFIGSGLIGKRHVLDFRAEPDVAAVAVAEVHRGRSDEATALIGGTVKGTGNFLWWLDDRDVDAVLVSTLDHWHVLMTMMACVASKDVYVGERPSRGDRLSPGQPVATARRELRWDPAREMVLDGPDTAGMRERPDRAPWDAIFKGSGVG